MTRTLEEDQLQPLLLAPIDEGIRSVLHSKE